MSGHTITFLGEAVTEATLTINDGFDQVVSTDVNAMVSSWQGALDMTGGVE
jgi:hypothetical protein